VTISKFETCEKSKIELPKTSWKEKIWSLKNLGSAE
jgi:hypothetical protein